MHDGTCLSFMSVNKSPARQSSRPMYRLFVSCEQFATFSRHEARARIESSTQRKAQEWELVQAWKVKQSCTIPTCCSRSKMLRSAFTPSTLPSLIINRLFITLSAYSFPENNNKRASRKRRICLSFDIFGPKSAR